MVSPDRLVAPEGHQPYALAPSELLSDHWAHGSHPFLPLKMPRLWLSWGVAANHLHQEHAVETTPLVEPSRPLVHACDCSRSWNEQQAFNSGECQRRAGPRLLTGSSAGENPRRHIAWGSVGGKMLRGDSELAALDLLEPGLGALLLNLPQDRGHVSWPGSVWRGGACLGRWRGGGAGAAARAPRKPRGMVKPSAMGLCPPT
jgi:hypothetical protein